MSNGRSGSGEWGRKERRGKLRYDLMPPRSFERVVEVLTYGAEKYTVYGDCTCNLPNTGHAASCQSHKVKSKGDNNWKLVDDPIDTYYAAALRHLQKFRLGEELDPDSGIHHIAHAITDLIFLLEFEEDRLSQNGTKERP